MEEEGEKRKFTSLRHFHPLRELALKEPLHLCPASGCSFGMLTQSFQLQERSLNHHKAVECELKTGNP